ncbi:molybdopterin-dependent oxidoreductase [Actinoplanes sp. L3-i22]|uniref:molybdopterin-dependent oxidoreductase n=1 Tax=Actinoplanes sp. L3-i22 TaxID=2836373 RepID=UPI001C787C2F|nr:molybdopterin-dependent oxidoreductase [Actinoplanes sp. L3-i22]BCY05625.1 oxidoreductase [Actinoplanes sp. L3-i22]
MRTSIRAGLAGVAAAAAALGVAELLAVFAGARSAPLVAVGGVVVDHVPPGVKDFAIATFGTHDKTALLTGTAVLLGLYAYGVGVLAARRRPFALAGIALFGVVGIAAAVTRPGAGVAAGIPSAVGAALAVWVLRHLLGLEGASHETDPEARRRFLKQVGIVAAVAVGGGTAGRWLTSRGAATEARKELTLPAASEPPPVVPAGAQVPGAVPYVTPNADFYRIDTALISPQVDPANWTLKIHGMVRNPIEITWAELLQRPMVERYVTLACVSNEVGGDLIGNALWLGTPIKALLDEADPLPGADQVVQRSTDGWTCGTPTAALRDGRDALLAIGMNGEPLPVEHGFPVRMIVPGLYGYVSACKWITEIELTRFSDFDAYWVPRGWSAQGPIKTESRIDTPRDHASRKPGPVAVAGVAWAQHRGIAKVEVQVDDGAWETASLAPAVSDDTWRQWKHTWTASSGEHVLRVRATDLDGYTQTSDLADPAPDGATGWHQVTVSVS